MRDDAARLECAEQKQQTEAWRVQMQQLEVHLTSEQAKQQALRHSLVAVNTKVGALSSELDYWKQEVQRIDAEAEQQHQEDSQSISDLISRLPRPTTVATQEHLASTDALHDHKRRTE